MQFIDYQLVSFNIYKTDSLIFIELIVRSIVMPPETLLVL